MEKKTSRREKVMTETLRPRCTQRGDSLYLRLRKHLRGVIRKRVPYQLLVPAKSPLNVQLGPFLPARLLRKLTLVLADSTERI